MASIHPEQHRTGRKSWRVKVTAAERAAGYAGRSYARKSDAQLYVAQLTARIPVPGSAPVDRTTVADAIGRHAETRRASRATLAKEQSLSRRLAPIQATRLSDLRAADVRALVADLVDVVAPATAAAVLRHLRAVLAQAVDDGLITTNVATPVKVPTTIKPRLDESDVWDIPEIERVLAKLPERYRALVALRAYCGCRLSEALAITAADVDLLRGRVHVGHRVLEEVAGTAALRPTGKTRAADRWVPIPAPVAKRLEHHLATIPAGDHGLIFTTPDGSWILRDNFRDRVWEPAMAAAGVHRITLRNLRHTAISLMLRSGLTVLEIAARVGHAKPSLLLDTYARFIPSEQSADPYAAMLDRSITGLAVGS